MKARGLEMNSRTRRDRVRAEYAAAQAATVSCYRTPASRSKKDYYANGKHGTEGGIPIWRPKWYGELGNDAEYREAIKPRTAFKAAYYQGGHRMSVDGIPVRVAAYVKDWSAWMKRAIGSGAESAKEMQERERQMEILFPAYGREKALERAKHMVCCVDCHGEYYARETGDGECWHCEHENRQAA